MRPLKIKKMLSSTRLCCIILKMIEIEIKAHAKNKNAIKSTLNTIGKYEGFVVRHDYYYRHHNCLSYPARIRIEKSDNGQKIFLTHKNKSLVKDKNGVVSEKNEEKEAEISESAKEVLLSFFSESKIELYLEKEKRVETWKCAQDGFLVTAELCTIKPIGDFIELEILVEEQNDKIEKKAREALFAILKKLGAENEIEEKSYATLLKEEARKIEIER